MKKLMKSLLVAACFFLNTVAGQANITLINVFEVPKGKEIEAIAMWEQARDFLKKQPGYITTKLHQSVDENARFALINIAEWKDEASFKKAQSKMRAELKLPFIEGLRGNPTLYYGIRGDS